MVILRMRLDKFLSDSLIGTRSEVKNYIKKGCVTVNGEVCRDFSRKIDDAKDKVYYKNELISYQKERYYMLNKPAGVVCATKDNVNKTALELFDKSLQKGLILVGRLDKDTEGLIFVTTDGEFCHRLMSPKKHVKKCYYFEAKGSMDSSKKARIEEGIFIGEDEPVTLPAILEIIESNIDSFQGYLTITEGRFHQVKRMFQAVGCEVMYLKRVSVGDVWLDESLELGSYRELSGEELKKLM